ncbi:MAG: MFS transporter [Deltaproteobacteria bacterium]|nr:MFS transporter [Deltaproteobacteria bacterium]
MRTKFIPHRSTSLTPGQQSSSLIWKVCVATLCRLVLNSARRFAYPFAPALSRGLGVPLTAITTIIAANQSTAIIGMFFGPLADRLGYRLMMLAGLGVLVVGMIAGGIFPFYGVILAALFLAGLGKSIFDPALQAYVGERVPFHRRGLIIGVLELSWAGSTLIGIPLIGLLIEYLGWRAPFFALGGVGLIGIAALQFVIAKDGKKTVMHQTAGIFNAWRQLVQERAALGAIGFAFFVCAANDSLFVIYGAWLETSFNLSIVALGFSTTVIGIAELSGEGLTAAVSDRLGLKRSVIVGLSLCIMSYIILPLMGKTLPLALGSLFLIFLTFEFTIVSALSLCTELLPGLRATMMSGFLAAAGIGRVIGVLIGGSVWLTGGIVVTAFISAAISCLGLASLAWGLRGWKLSY